MTPRGAAVMSRPPNASSPILVGTRFGGTCASLHASDALSSGRNMVRPALVLVSLVSVLTLSACFGSTEPATDVKYDRAL